MIPNDLFYVSYIDICETPYRKQGASGDAGP